MKKILMTLAIALSTLGVFAGNDADVNPKVLNAFNNEFKTARGVIWNVSTDYYRADFTYNDKYVFAYYSVNGDLLGLSRYITQNDLPMNLQNDLRKSYTGYWISDLFEVANTEGTAYYVTLENADTKLVLKSSDAKYWNRYNKVKKS